MKIALGQINPVVGDFAGNCDKICQYIERAVDLHCDLVVFPEMALLGYPPLDFLERNDFVQNSLSYWEKIIQSSRQIAVVCGVAALNPSPTGKPFFNTALFCFQGQVLLQAHKILLPSYDVFDESRYFEPGEQPEITEFKGYTLGLTICEDIWTRTKYLPYPFYDRNPVQELLDSGTNLLINIAASPFVMGKSELVRDLLQEQAVQGELHVVHVNQVGGNDELIFQGQSKILNQKGKLLAQAADFAEELLSCDILEDKLCDPGDSVAVEQELLQALVLGLKDYMGKCGFNKLLLGLSGGLDSALAACLARMAAGNENVMALALPGPYNAPYSLEDARELAHRLEIHLETVHIDELFALSKQALEPIFRGSAQDVSEENIQSRLRGMLLMAVSNKFNYLLLNTGNKSELAVGYCTLYGDMNGGIAVLGDVSKTMVYRLARFINSTQGWIPERIISRPPSAELSPDQKDQDILPDYEVLDKILQAYIEDQQSPEQMIKHGWDSKLVGWVIKRVMSSEYKRRQAPPVLKVSGKAFGLGRRLPLAQKFNLDI